MPRGRKKKITEEVAEAMRAYKAEGRTMAEVAERFGVSTLTANVVCKGIAPQRRPQEYRNQFTTGAFDRVANAVRYIEERTPGFEYAGGFTGIDGFVLLRCKTCGEVERRSFVSVKQGTATCTFCKRAEAEKLRAEQAEERAKKAAERERTLYINRMKRQRPKQYALRACKCCGSLFVDVGRGAACSETCAKRMRDAISKEKRVRRIHQLIVDKDITWQGIAARDGNNCYLCGEPVDANDYEMRGDVFIAGNNYPSIDHVIPLSHGGAHAWENVKLAHRRCNTAKGARVWPPYAE